MDYDEKCRCKKFCLLDMTTEKKPIRNERFKDLLINRFNYKQSSMAKVLGISASLNWRYAYEGKGKGEDMNKHIHNKLDLTKDWLDGVDSESIVDDVAILKAIGRTKETWSVAELERVKEFLTASIQKQNEALVFLKEEKIDRSKESGKGDESK